VDERFAAVYTDAEFALDPSHERFSLIKGRRSALLALLVQKYTN
jgi:hypothetical protein